MIYKTKLKEEIQDDYSCEVVHNHLEPCPVCGQGNATTDRYSQIEVGENVMCEFCGSQFKVISLPDSCTIEIEI